MNVLKFGGTSMGDAETWQRVLNIIETYSHPFVVVSATSNTTRKLLASAQAAINDLDKANEIANEISQRHHELIQQFIEEAPGDKRNATGKCEQWINACINELKKQLANIHQSQQLSNEIKDAILATGERLSSYLFVQCGQLQGFSTTWVDAADVIKTDADFGQASPDKEYITQKAPQLRNLIADGQIPVMGGFYGQEQNGNITTLGFEGSDYTASLVGAALQVDSIEIWTDVSGIYTCDPRYVEQASPISQLSFQEATELAYFGAKVLHPSTTKPASQKGIPIKVKNIFAPDEPGTCISEQSDNSSGVKAITFKEQCSVITVTSSNTVMGYKFLANVFDILRWHHLPVDVVTTTEASVSIAIEDEGRLNKAVEQLQSCGSVKLTSDQGIISLVGCQNNNTHSLIDKVLGTVNKSRASMVSYSQTKGNLNIVAEKGAIIPSVKAIHQKLFS